MLRACSVEHSKRKKESNISVNIVKITDTARRRSIHTELLIRLSMQYCMVYSAAMTFIFIVLGLVNVAWLYIYTAVRFPTAISIPWLSLSFEPARYIAIALTMVFALQLCLIAYLYFSFLWQRRVYRANAQLKAQAKIFAQKQKEYIASTKQFESLLQNTSDTKGQVALLENHIQELVGHHAALEAQVQQVLTGNGTPDRVSTDEAGSTTQSPWRTFVANVKKAPKSFFPKK